MRLRILCAMGPIEHIRKNVLDLSQVELAAIAGTTQATVSRWEAGQLEPSRAELARIRSAVMERGLPWDDCWFFEAPVSAVAS
jgi:DNA-binding transcriptional regulator YiaG